MRTHRTNNTPRRLLRGGVTLLAAVAVGLPAASAFALGRADVENLQRAGLGCEIMVNVIRSSTEPLTMSEADVQALRAQGVCPPVLDELCIRIGCAAAGPGPGFPGAPGPGGPNPSLQAEQERQRQLEMERQRIEQQRIEQERQMMRERIAAEDARSSQVQQAYEGLARAQRLYREGKLDRAAAMYDRFLTEVKPDPQSREYYDGLTGFVRSMHKAGYRHLIRTQALEAALYGPTWDHFQEMISILSDISSDASYSDPRIEELTGLPIGDLPAEFQDEFNFFLGRFFWRSKEYDRAVQFFGRLSESSPKLAQGHYLSGVMLLEKKENRRAVQEFQKAVSAAEAGHGEEDVAELGYLALARIAYETGGLDAALFYYNKIKADSFRRPQVMFETAWSYFMKQDWNRALGALHTLHSPAYDRYFWPDLYVVEAAIHLSTCNLESAELAVQSFNQTVAALERPVQTFIAETANPVVYWESITQYNERAKTSDPVKLPAAAVRFVLQDAGFKSRWELIRQLERELSFLDRDGGVLEEFAKAQRDILAADIETRKLDAGLYISGVLLAFNTDLTDWKVKVQEVGIEVTRELLARTQRELSGGTSAGAEGTSLFVLAQDWQYWPYEGEYWADEIENYRADVKNLRDEETNACLVAE